MYHVPLGIPTIAFPSPSPPSLIARDSVVGWAVLKHQYYDVEVVSGATRVWLTLTYVHTPAHVCGAGGVHKVHVVTISS